MNESQSAGKWLRIRGSAHGLKASDDGIGRSKGANRFAGLRLQSNLSQNCAADAFRAFAAILVVLEHVRAMFFLDYSEIQGGPAAGVFYFGTSLGHEAVMIFFVMSGYWVGLSVIKSFESGRFTWADYGVRRLTRLWIVLVPAIVVTAVTVWIGLTWFGTTGPFSGNPAYHDLAPKELSANSGFGDALGNVFFLQTITSPVYGTNAPLWSLTNEFWYYALFPLLLFAVSTQLRVGLRLAALIVALAISLFVGGEIMSYFPVWLVGAALAVWRRRISDWLKIQHQFRLAGLRLIAVLGLALALATSESGRVPMWASVVVVTFATCVLLALLLTDLRIGSRIHRVLRPLAAYASVSYTLYLVHVPLLLLFTAIAIPDPTNRFSPGLAGYSSFVAVTAALMIVAWLLGQATERRTGQARAQIVRWIGLTRRSDAVG